jgi:TIR domain-containing protein
MPDNLEVTFSVPRDVVPKLIQAVEENFQLLPNRIESPQSAYPDKQIFINYRHLDSEDICGRIYDRLIQAFGRDGVFRDVANLMPGFDFRPTLERAVAKCNVMLVIMGRDWLNEENRARLHDANDYVRFEIETALKRDNVPVIPVWVGRREIMPQKGDLPPTLHDLLHRQARKVQPDPDFHTDVDKLIEDIKTIFDLQDELGQTDR